MKVPVVQRFRESVGMHGDRTAVTCGDVSVTFAQLDLRSNRLARQYVDLGVRFGDLVTIALPNSIDFVESVVATWKLGAVPQPVSWQLPVRERDEIIELAKPALVVGVSDPPDGYRAIPAGYRIDASVDDSALPEIVSPHIRAMTSGGSTGRPKLILSTDEAEFDFDRAGFPIASDAVQLVAGPMYHMAPFSYGVLGMVAGQSVVVLPKFEPLAALRAIERHRVTTAMIVPTMLLRMARVLDDESFDLSSLQALWHTGGPCPPWVKERWIDLIGGERLHELYGSSESIATCSISGTEWLEHRGSVGRPIIGEVKVVDPGGTNAAPGEIGEIFMRRGDGQPSPYRYVGAQRRVIDGGWESVGDLGYLDDGGYLYLVDRGTDMIVSGGVNVYPAEVEAALSEHPAVAASAVVGLPDDELGQRVHAVVQPVTGAEVQIEDLRSFVADRLARPKVPRSFRLTDDVLLTEAGKLRRSAVRQAELERQEHVPAPR